LREPRKLRVAWQKGGSGKFQRKTKTGGVAKGRQNKGQNHPKFILGE